MVGCTQDQGAQEKGPGALPGPSEEEEEQQLPPPGGSSEGWEVPGGHCVGLSS